MFKPSYIALYNSGELTERIEKANELLRECQLCPRRCKVNRLSGEKGICKTGKLPIISSYSPHWGEESPLVGEHGSGTIFITNCNLGCIFCQNYEISHLDEGNEVSLKRFAEMMLRLKDMGCHNINFVTPTHVIPQILTALPIAIEEGLDVPLVYNTGGYDLVESLELLDGVFDIYMPDFKFADSEVSARYCKAKDYPEIAKAAVKEMHRQVGDLIINNESHTPPPPLNRGEREGVAERGLLIRHLVMPGGLAGTRKVMKFLAAEISKNTYVNIMNQYHPCGQAHKYPPIDRSTTFEEYQEAVKIAHEEGIERLDNREARVRILKGF
ncbi:MAG: radical SAM protein [Candidatus Brocadiales bacterium]